MAVVDEQNAANRWRVKLYELETQGTWLDQGTGFVSCQHVQNIGSPALIVSGEEGKPVLLESKIMLEDVYEKQGDSIVMWRERCPAGDVDYALSFQDTAGCQAVWSTILSIQQQCRYQIESMKYRNGQDVSSGGVNRVKLSNDENGTGSPNKNPYFPDDQEIPMKDAKEWDEVNPYYGNKHDEFNSESNGVLSPRRCDTIPYGTDHSLYTQDNEYDMDRNASYAGGNYTPFTNSSFIPSFPEVTVDNLVFLKNKLNNVQPKERESYALSLVQNSYSFLTCLATLFHQIENEYNQSMKVAEEEEADSNGNSAPSMTPPSLHNRLLCLHQLHEIADVMRLVLLLNDSAIVSYYVNSEENYYELAGMLEYDNGDGITCDASGLCHKADYRQFLATSAKLVIVCPPHITTPHDCNNSINSSMISLVPTITRLFRLNYLKNIMMRPNEELYFGHHSSAINSMISFDTNEVVCKVNEDVTYMRELLHMIGKNDERKLCDVTSIHDNLVDERVGVKAPDTPVVPAPVSSYATTNDRSAAIRFVRDFFFLSRNLTFEKR